MLIASSLAPVWLVGSVEAVRQSVAETSLQYALAAAARELVFRGTRCADQKKRCSERFTRPWCK